MRPVKILLFTLGVFILLASAMWITPSEGVKLGEFTFHMPTFKEMFFDEKPEYTDVSEILDHQFSIDSLVSINTDSVATGHAEVIRKASYDSLVRSITRIEMNDSAWANLHRFFKKLEQDTLTRIMHYGDSQIEGDRITAFLRNKMQTHFGGTGPGLRPALQPYNYVFSASQEYSANWKRYPIYGNVDSLVEHRNYGVMGAFSRYAPLTSDTVPFAGSINYKAFLSISKTDISFKRTREYEHLRLFYGNTKRPVSLKIFVKGDLFRTDTLKQDLDYATVECDLPDTTSRVSMHFEGFDGPDIYGIELASTKGVIVDNIALRGSSGLIFTKNDFEHSRKMYDDLSPDLFILQFGGNVMPYIQDEKAIENYGRWFRLQIERLQLLCPDAAIIVIGPSDMSTKEKDRYVTYSYLPDVVNVLKDAALSTGSGFWNMYEAMGGENSMPSWVNAEPELARPDYTHFSARGARLIANMFYNALILEYNNYLEEKQ